MSFLTNFAVGALMNVNYPVIDRRQCYNMRPHKQRCTACVDICPQKLFDRPGIVKDFTACEGCGLCVSVCRSRCIMPTEDDVERDLKPMDKDGKQVWLGCERSTRQNDAVRTCVASFAWENLAYMALNKKLVIDLTPCEKCDSEACKQQVRKEMQRLLEFLGEKLFTARITMALKEEDAPYTALEYDRREMFSHLTSGSRNSTRQLIKKIPGLTEDKELHGTDHRLMLHQCLKSLKASMPENPVKFGWYFPDINDKCYGCGKCEKACKAGALKIQEDEQGIGRVVVTAWKCSECGMCIGSCTDKAFTELTLRQVTTLGPVSVHKIVMHHCLECGKPCKPDAPDGLCVSCISKHRIEKSRQLAEQRRAEREAKKAAEAAEKAAAEKATMEATAANPENEIASVSAEPAVTPETAIPTTSVNVAESGTQS